MSVVNSLPLTGKFHNVDSRRDGLMSKEDKAKLDSLTKSFSYEFIVSQTNWTENEDGEYIVNIEIPEFTSDMYAIVIPQSSCTRKEYYEIADSDLTVRNNSDGTLEITATNLPQSDLKLTAIYSSNAVMVSVPELYRDNNSVYEFTLRAADWAGDEAPYTQTIVVDGLNPSMYGAVALAEDYSAQELRAAILAKIEIDQQDNMVIFSATEEKPTIDIRGHITFGNNVAMSFYPLGNLDGLVEAKSVPFDNSEVGIDNSPKNVQDALSIIWDRFVRTTTGEFTTEQKLELKIGLQLFDTVLGKPVWCKSTNPYVFVDATGLEVYRL